MPGTSITARSNLFKKDSVMNKDYATNKELNNTKEELLDKLVSK